MKKVGILTVIMAVAAWLAWSQLSQRVDPGEFSMKNAVLLRADVISGGPPSEADLARARNLGFRTVIDLRRVEETAAEREAVTGLGMQYVNIPVTPDTLSLGQVDAVAKILEDKDNRPAILHCGSGNRVAGLWGLYLNRHQNVSAEQAMAIASEKGLTSDAVRSAVGNLLKKE